MFPFKHRCWLKPEKIMPNSEHHAIVIGINDYPLSGLAPLEGPVNDAKEFYVWLRDPEGGNLPESNIRRILSSDFPSEEAQPTPNQVEALFEPFISNYYIDKKEGERLYIFAAGHGFGDPDEMDRTALYAANAKKMFPWHVAVTDYVDWMRRHAIFDEIVLIMDCCRTSAMQYHIREPQYVVTPGDRNAAEVKCFSAFAVGRGQEARERRFADGKRYGIFTRTMLDALRVTRPDEQGRVTGQLLKNQIHNSLSKFAGDVQVEPPKIQLDSANDITFFQRKKTAGLPVRVDLKDYSGTETLVLYNGEFKEIRQERASAASLSFELEPGLYKIAVSSTGRQKIFEVPNNERITV
jgi:hypothetical protein